MRKEKKKEKKKKTSERASDTFIFIDNKRNDSTLQRCDDSNRSAGRRRSRKKIDTVNTTLEEWQSFYGNL